MDRSTALSLLGSIPDQFVSVIRDAHDDYRHGVPADHQPTLDATVRARYIHNRIGHRLLLSYGTTGPISVRKIDSLQFLGVDANPQGVLLRWKKGNRYTFKSSNHDSERQESLQSDGELLFGVAPFAQLFIAYTENEDDPVAPELERVALTRERDGAVEWQQVIWVAEAAPEPIRIDTGFEQLQMPPRFKVKAKAITADAVADGAAEQLKKAE